MPATSTSPIKILSDLGYQLVDIESDEDYLSALMEAVNSLGASDYRIPLLQDEITLEFSGSTRIAKITDIKTFKGNQEYAFRIDIVF